MRQSSDTQSLVERRRFPRYFCPGNVEILLGGKRWGWGKVRDISRCGCYIETNNPMPGGAQAHLLLSIADTFLEVATNVTCTNPQVGMGVDFVMESPAQQNKLVQILERVTFLLDFALNSTAFSMSAAMRRAEVRKGRDARLAAFEYLDLHTRQQGRMARAIVQLEMAIINSRLKAN